jgi:vancomycin resistance protein YoaR
MVYSFDQDRARSFLADNLKSLEIKPQNASFTVKKDLDNNLSFAIDPERVGKQIDYDSAFLKIEEHLDNLDIQAVPLKTVTSRPTIYTDDLEPLTTAAENLISQEPLQLTASSTVSGKSRVWTIDKNTLASWVISTGQSGDYHLALDLSKITDYLKNKIAPAIDQEALLPKYEIKDGKMTSWQGATDGQKLDLKASAAKINAEYIAAGHDRIALVINTVKSPLVDNVDNLHIEEIIGTGHSNFSGSSAARIKNIQIGAKAINGMLIAPGEEFSLIKSLGTIDASTGYVPELVIKNNQTIPEYGGGLCQVGTTVFRSALASGLPITARQNHSYRVSYYEPAGTDAAVYDPWPDVRFINDTGNYILIQSRINKNDIYFDFWGKKDGRIAYSSKPVIYNITKPAPAKIIETTTLKPGEKKCTERAHNGADAYFDYKVTYSDGNIQTKRFKSHYVPWQEVCLIGKNATSTVPTATSTTSKK